MRVSDVMTRNVETISAAAPAHAAIGRMMTRKVRHLPVVDQLGSLVGVVTDRDLRHHLFSPGVFERIGRVASDELLMAGQDITCFTVTAFSSSSDETRPIRSNTPGEKR